MPLFDGTRSLIDLEPGNTPGKQDRTGVGPQETPADEGDGTVWESLFIPAPNTPPSPRNTQQPEQPWHKTFKGWKSKLEITKTVLEVVAIPFAIIYAVITYLQWHDANRNFRIDQRAWVHRYIDTKAPEVLVPVNAGNVLMIPVVFTNTGKTPAFDVRGSIILSLLPTGTSPEFVYTTGHPRAEIVIESMWPGTNSNPIPAALLQIGATSPIPVLISESQRQEIITGALTISVHGRIEYRDVFKEHHWLKFCWEPDFRGTTTHGQSFKIEKSESQACVNNNDTDNN